MTLERLQAAISGRPCEYHFLPFLPPVLTFFLLPSLLDMIQDAQFDTLVCENAEDFQIQKWKIGVFLVCDLFAENTSDPELRIFRYAGASPERRIFRPNSHRAFCSWGQMKFADPS